MTPRRETLAAAGLWWLSAAAYLLVQQGRPGSESPANDAALAACAAAIPRVYELRAEWQLVCGFAALAVACIWLAVQARAPLARLWLAWCAWEAAQVAACSIGAWGLIVPMGSGLCLERYGYAPSIVLMIGSLLWVHYRGGGLWQQRNR